MPGTDVAFLMVGSGGVRVNPRRGGTSQIVDISGRPFLIDCGRLAVNNMVNFGYPVEAINDVLISHLHFDHVCDLSDFAILSFNNCRPKKFKVYGPEGTERFMELGIRQAYQQDIQSRIRSGKSPASMDWDVHEITKSGVVIKSDDFIISSLQTAHGGLPNFNYRFDVGDLRIVITSDTEPDDALVDFSESADLLVCECSGTKQFLETQGWGTWHMNPQSVADLASRSGAKQVVLKHLVIENFSDDADVSEKMAEEIRQDIKGEVQVGYDGLRIEFQA